MAVVWLPRPVAAPVADYTVGMIIAESRNIARSSLTANGGSWVVRFRNYPYSHNLADKTVGIIGYGAIGQMVAERLRAFGCRIIAYENYMPAEKVRALGAEPVSLDRLLETSDFITIHARLSEESRGMLGREEFRRMKPSAFFINTARAGLIDEDALIRGPAGPSDRRGRPRRLLPRADQPGQPPSQARQRHTHPPPRGDDEQCRGQLDRRPAQGP